MIKGHTYDKQLYNSVAHRLLNREFLDNENGILNQGSKCEMTYTTNSITVNDGFIVIQGGITEIEYSDTVNVELDDSFCKLVYELDLSKVNDESNFNQGVLKIISSASGYPNLTQEVLTENSGVYQFELAQFRAALAGITDFVDKRTYLRSGDTLDWLKTALGLDNDTYNSSNTYSIGDLVIKNHQIYKANEDSITGTWNPTKWILVPIVEAESNNIKINNELNKGWTLLKKVTGTTPVDLSKVDYSEILVVVNATHPNNYPVYGTILIPKLVLSDTEYRYFDTGAGATAPVSDTSMRVGVTTSTVVINGVTLAGGTILTSSATMQVFYK